MYLLHFVPIVQVLGLPCVWMLKLLNENAHAALMGVPLMDASAGICPHEGIRTNLLLL